jgi:hypothetical protein
MHAFTTTITYKYASSSSSQQIVDLGAKVAEKGTMDELLGVRDL